MRITRLLLRYSNLGPVNLNSEPLATPVSVDTAHSIPSLWPPSSQEPSEEPGHQASAFIPCLPTSFKPVRPVLSPSRSGHFPFIPTAAAAAQSLQSCPTLCDPIDGSPPGSPVPGILQARTLEWVAISFSNA